PDGHPAVALHVQPQYYLGSRAYEYIPPAILEKTAATTDQNGRAELPNYLPEKMSGVNVIGDDWGTQQFEGFQKEDLADLTLKLLPVGRIEGRILADQPELFRNVFIAIETNEPTAESRRCTGQAMLQVDQDGRFVVPRIAVGMVEMYADIDDRLP